jgi:hypothetical protein
MRVPCPGGSGGRTGGWVVLASVASPSFFTPGAFGWLAAGGFTGVDAGILEILIEKVLRLVAPDL